MSERNAVLELVNGVGYINLRGDARNRRFLKAVDTQLRVPLPLTANTSTRGEHSIYWLGPDEWLVATPESRTTALCEKLSAACAQLHAAVNDLSGGLVTMQLSGSTAREILSKGCTLDLHPDRFSASVCAQTGLAKAGVLLACTENGIDIIVRRSFADYVSRWLLVAGAEYGIEFT